MAPEEVPPAFDYYGFPLSHLTQSQTSARQWCDQKENEQARVWAKLAKKGMLPGDAELKKLCRKVVHSPKINSCPEASQVQPLSYAHSFTLAV